MRMPTVILLLACISLLAAQGTNRNLSDEIMRISEDLLAGYVQPLVDVFNTGISTGLYHSAYSHDFLGFDLGVRLMYINIPDQAKYFSGTVMMCSLVIDSMVNLVRYEVELEGLSTILGPWNPTTVPTEGYAVAVPPIIPGGIGLSGVPLVMPQLNIGLFLGSEIALRFVPYNFVGANIRFYGIGLKQQLTKLPPLNLAELPFAIALAGAYQEFSVKTPGQGRIVTTETWNVQAIISARFGAVEPMCAFGMEGTTAEFDYALEYELPDTITGILGQNIRLSEEISLRLRSPRYYRAVLGFTLHSGFLFMHYDFNFTPYLTHNLMFGLSFR